MPREYSGDARIDGLLSSYTTPSPIISWQSEDELGTPVSLDFSFLSSGTNGVSGFAAMNTNLQAAVNTALTHFESVANVTFNQVGAGAGEMNFGTANFGGSSSGFVAGVAYTSWNVSSTHSSYTNANVYLTNASFANYSSADTGSSAYTTLLHEIGHGLGLDHSFSGVTVPAGTDSDQYTIMSYTDFFPNGVNPTSLMLYDIMAIQYLYGANTSYNANDTLIDLAVFLGNGPAVLWDGGGNDTISLASLAFGLTFDLTEGVFNTVNNTFDFVIAYGAAIENVIGSGFADTLVGTVGKDTLFGGDGNDKLFGGNSNDTMVGGAGDDKLFGGAGTNTADYSDDTLGITVTTSSATGTGIGTDTLNKISKVLGGSGDDNITGGGAANVIYGNDGDDTFFGGGGNDKLFGGSGADTFFGGTGNDKMFGGAGRDTADYSDDTLGITATAKQVTGAGVGTDKLNKIENVTGGSGNDMITGGSAANILTGNAGDDTLNGGNGNDTLFGGTGADRINGGKANDQLFGGGADGAADVFIFGDGFGDDTIGDWEDGFDLIDFTTHSVINDISDLNIDQSSGVNTEITFGAHSITIEGFVGTIDANDFVF